MSIAGLTRSVLARRTAFQWWWLIWAAAGCCIFLCGLTLGLASAGSGHDSGWFGQMLAPSFGGRSQVSILAVGVDRSTGRGLADTIIAAVVRPRSGEIAAVSVPRDSRVLVPGVGVRRVNEAHSFGGLPLTIETVELLLGIPFDYYVEVDIPGMVKLVDAVGGVEVEVEKRMYYRDRSQDLLIDLQPGRQKLMGKQAMGYVRFRHDPMGDLGRIQRQREFLRALARQLLAPEKAGHIPELAGAFVQTLNTNLSVRDLLALRKMVEDSGAEAIRMVTLPGEPRLIHGRSMIELDGEEVQEVVDRVLLGHGLSVAVLNGTEEDGLATRTASFLERQGCDIVEIGNAEQQSDTTLIADHRGGTKRAERVWGWLGCGAISTAPDGENPADVTVILGRDMASAGR